MIGKRLKVLSVSHTAHGLGSGRLRYEAFAATGEVELILVVPDRWRESGRDKPAEPNASTLDIRFRPVRLPFVKGIKWYGHWYPGLGTLIRKFSPDVLHLWEEPWGVFSLQASILRNRYAPHAALIFETEQNILHRLPLPFEQIRRHNLKHADWLIVRSKEAAAVSFACGYQGKYTTVEYCVDRSTFRPIGMLFESSLATQSSKPRELKLGYVGRLIKEKGLFTVLKALKSSRDLVSFTLMGDGPAKSELESWVNSNGLQARVRFVASQRPDAVAEFMHSLDALVLMSETNATWKEQFGRVIIEAQACGIPVIGSSSGAIPSVVRDGGWIVPEGDAVSLGRLLDKLCDDPRMISEGKMNALLNVDRFGPTKVAHDMLAACVGAAACRQAHLNQLPNKIDLRGEKSDLLNSLR